MDAFKHTESFNMVFRYDEYQLNFLAIFEFTIQYHIFPTLVLVDALCVKFCKVLNERVALDDFSRNCLYSGVWLIARWIHTRKNESMHQLVLVYCWVWASCVHLVCKRLSFHSFLCQNSPLVLGVPTSNLRCISNILTNHVLIIFSISVGSVSFTNTNICVTFHPDLVWVPVYLSIMGLSSSALFY